MPPVTILLLAAVFAVIGAVTVIIALVRLYGVTSVPRPPAGLGMAEVRIQDLQQERTRVAERLEALESLAAQKAKDPAETSEKRERLEAHLDDIQNRLEKLARQREAADMDRASAVEKWKEAHPFHYRRSIATAAAAGLWLLLSWLTVAFAGIVGTL